LFTSDQGTIFSEFSLICFVVKIIHVGKVKRKLNITPPYMVLY